MVTAEEALLQHLARETVLAPERLRVLKTRIGRQFGVGMLRNDRLLARYRELVTAGRLQPSSTVEGSLRQNRMRTQSGVATVTILTKPYACPGRCVYCPTERGVPKSYLANEPAVMRAIRHDYDPYTQVQSRLQALINTGHPVDKIELLIKGGTWSFYPRDYQAWCIQRCFEACNDAEAANLDEAQTANETAARRLVGITIETRPDYVTDDEVRQLRRLGVTRVELGVQSLDDEVLALTIRDHTVETVAQATRLLKDAGFKVTYHLMPGLPGSTPARDIETVRTLFADERFQPDQLKFYPCVVVPSAELYEWWKAGHYQPYTDKQLTEVLIAMKHEVPPYVRIERVVRDIPSTSTVAGGKLLNLREVLHRTMAARGLRCVCIRCREVRDQRMDEDVQLVRRNYAASGGQEVFLSFESADGARLYAVLRLRRTGSGEAFVRELHTYGPTLPLDEHADAAAQHRGLGRRLMAEAERIAAEEWRCERLAVIAGVGVREYYRKLGYQLEATYMTRALVHGPTGDAPPAWLRAAKPSEAGGAAGPVGPTPDSPAAVPAPGPCHPL
ncbi:MAG: tRNA uridine(34) 5-carboxymethylaminomethyl modification radical SAM/GNAT enzyme Elp3 [Candidatus Omnitrophica bacterium]|nr:tRNA uridine(34) 5-carboxymethylaminomethyl modification radical SAM/GNAT enzyme Elp3 [Candidatus Omnitrophota bacterium]